jgi:hypothetical protein
MRTLEWVFGALALLGIVVTAAEVVIGRRKIRTAKRYGVTGRDDWTGVYLGIALLLIDLGLILDGWAVWVLPVALVVVGWMVIRRWWQRSRS